MEEKTEITQDVVEAEEIESAPEQVEMIEEEAEAAPEEAPDSEQSEEQDAEQPAEADGLSDEEARAVIEVLLLVSDKPLSVGKIKEILDGVGAKKIHELVEQVSERLLSSGFPYQVREVGGGYALSTLPEYAPWVRKLYEPKAKTAKLSPAALETLAIVAYKQPVTRAEMEAVRGVSVDSTLKTLLEKRLCEIAGYKDVIGKPATYGTTNEFLLHFGLNALADLPTIEELRRPDSGS